MKAQAKIFNAGSDNRFDFGRERGGDFQKAALGEADFGAGDSLRFFGANAEEFDFTGLGGEAIVDACNGGKQGGQFGGWFRIWVGSGSRFAEGDARLQAIHPFHHWFKSDGCDSGCCGPANAGFRGTAESEAGAYGDSDAAKNSSCHGQLGFSIKGRQGAGVSPRQITI
jgi:hypothetical protein